MTNQATPVNNDYINKLLEVPDAFLSSDSYSQALDRVVFQLKQSDAKKNKNIEELIEHKEASKELQSKNKELQTNVDDLVTINDNDRETIIVQTKQIDKLNL